MLMRKTITAFPENKGRRGTARLRALYNSRVKTARHENTNIIGVIVHELQSDFITAAVSGIGEVAAGFGYEIIITHSRESMEKEVENAQALFNQQVQGVIASLSFGTSDLQHFESFLNAGVPVVFFDRVEKTGSNGTVVIDNTACGYMATDHLIQQGCKRIAIVTSTMERNVYADRFDGFIRALLHHKIPFTEELLIVNDISVQAGVEAAAKVMAMETKPDGLFITNDLVAAVCMRRLMEAGVRIPDDIAVVGFNNDSICKITVPTLTTINYPGIEMGRMAGMKLFDRLLGKPSRHFETTVVPAELVVRRSSLKKV
jgi:LacI family transcriptional regulator